MEAWWKHEGKNRCAILTIRAQATHPDPARNWRKARKNSGYYAINHGSFDTTHNLKVTGSNPVPATKIVRNIKELNVERFAHVSISAKRVNATSTFEEPARIQAGFLQ